VCLGTGLETSGFGLGRHLPTVLVLEECKTYAPGHLPHDAASYSPKLPSCTPGPNPHPNLTAIPTLTLNPARSITVNHHPNWGHISTAVVLGCPAADVREVHGPRTTPGHASRPHGRFAVATRHAQDKYRNELCSVEDYANGPARPRRITVLQVEKYIVRSVARSSVYFTHHDFGGDTTW